MQLDLFTSYEEDTKEIIRTEKANKLLFMLNEGRKKKDFYEPQYYALHGDYYILIASTKDKDVVGNIIDSNGDIPNGFSVCWRNMSLIRQELQEICN